MAGTPACPADTVFCWGFRTRVDFPAAWMGYGWDTNRLRQDTGEIRTGYDPRQPTLNAVEFC